MHRSGMSHMRKQVQLVYVVSNFILRMYFKREEAQNQNYMTLEMLWYARRKVACCYRKSSEKNSCRLSKQKQ